MESLEGITDARYLNSVIKELSDRIDAKYISDGNHTFQQLYDYIAYIEALFINVALAFKYDKLYVKKEVINESEFCVQIIYLGTTTTKKYPIKYLNLFKDISERKIIPQNLNDFLLA